MGPTEPKPAAPVAAPPAAPPSLPPVPTPVGEFTALAEDLKACKEALTVILQEVMVLKQEKAKLVADYGHIFQQIKAKFIGNDGKLKWWPFS